MLTVAQEDKRHTLERPPLPPPFPQLLLLSVMSYGMEHPFSQFGPGVPGTPPPSPQCTRWSGEGAGQSRKEEKP